MFRRKLLVVLGLLLAWGISPSAFAGTMTLDSFVDQSPGTISLPATKLLMATVNTSASQGGNDASVTTVSIGGTVVAADIAEVCVDYTAAEVACQTSPGSLSNISISLGGNQKGGQPFDYRVTLNPSAGGKTIQLTVESISNTNLTDNIPLPASTATRNIDGGSVAPTVTLPTFADVTDTTATLGGTMTDDGGGTISDCGVGWSTSPVPTPPYPNNVSFGVCSVDTLFTVPVTGLDPAPATIYFRAWADNGAIGYTAEDSFPTAAAAAPPTVTTDAATAIGQNSATLGGDVTADGGATVTVRGIYWNTASPAEAGTPVPMGSGLGGFSNTVGGLPAGTRIYHRAYATNTAGEALGGELFFDTLVGLATVDTPTFADITATSATLGGTMSSDGGEVPSDCGVEWGTTSGGPYPNLVSDGACAEGLPFTTPVTGLTAGAPVYFRAYATNNAGTAYSTQLSFTPAGAPVVTSSVSGFTHNSATLGGDVTSGGGSVVTARGIVWDTVSPPEAGGTVVPMGSGLGIFSQLVGSLPSNTLIYFKAFATTSVQTGYSTEDSFTTLSEPTVQVSNLNVPTLAGRSMRITWTRGDGDGAIVVMRLQATGKTDPADGADYTANPEYTLAPELPVNSENFVVYKGPGTSVLVTGLTTNTDYSLAVYEYAGTGGSTDYLQLLPAEVDATTTGYAVHNYDYRADCDDCHNHGSFGARGPELKAVCEGCHNSLGQAAAKLEFDNHLAPNKNPAVDFVDCGSCHELHNPGGTNTTESLNSVTLVTQHNKSFLRANVDKYVTTASPPAYLHTDQPLRETPHPDAPQAAVTPDRAVEGGTDAIDPSTTTQARGYCQVCHSLTNYHRSSNTAGSIQTHDGVANDSGLGTEVNCGECHQHNNKFIGVGGSVTCTACHDSIQGTRPIITTQFDRLSTHIPGGSAVATQEDCLVCHDQGGHQSQLVSLWDADNGTTSYSQLTAGGSTTDPAEAEPFEAHCLSCHDDGSADSLAASGSDQTQTSPFTGSGAPPVIDEVAWASAAHNRSTAPVMSCVGGCHGSGHGSEQLSLLAPAAGPTASSTDFCYVCHDADGPSSLDIQAEFNTATNYQDASNSGALVNQRHDITAADQSYSGGVVSCKDCHLPHVDNNTNPVSDPDTGLALATYSPANSYTDDGNNFAYDSGGNNSPTDPEGGSGLVPEPDFIQFCLTCHDGTTPAGVTMSPSMINIAGEWGGRQHGGGDGSLGSKTGKGNLKPPWTTAADYASGLDPTANYSALNCTTCHGAHGSGSIHNLRDSITVAGVVMQVGAPAGSEFDSITPSATYTLPVNGGSQNDHEYGAWCTFCHNMSAHAGVDETSTCTSAHMHGGNSF